MVLAERHPETIRNGKRSRGQSPSNDIPSGNCSVPGASVTTNESMGVEVTPENSSDDESSLRRNGKNKTKQNDYEGKINVGRDYQAVCPPLIPEEERQPELLNDKALLVWSPSQDIPDSKLEEYISIACEKYGYNGEQALGMLFWHQHDLEKAVLDLANFTPFPDDWTTEDKILFEHAFQFHGKNFNRIRQMMPDKTIASLVKYYYSWKKSRQRQNVAMTRRARANNCVDEGESVSSEAPDNHDNEFITSNNTNEVHSTTTSVL